jgi:hypothetical protein
MAMIVVLFGVVLFAVVMLRRRRTLLVLLIWMGLRVLSTCVVRIRDIDIKYVPSCLHLDERCFGVFIFLFVSCSELDI